MGLSNPSRHWNSAFKKNFFLKKGRWGLWERNGKGNSPRIHQTTRRCSYLPPRLDDFNPTRKDKPRVFICHILQQCDRAVYLLTSIFYFPGIESAPVCHFSKSGGHRVFTRGAPMIERANRLWRTKLFIWTKLCHDRVNIWTSGHKLI